MAPKRRMRVPGPAQTLPPGLLDAIFENLDRHTLRRCNLTCRSWAARSIVYYFTFVSLWEIEEKKRFRALLLEFPRVGQYVKELEFQVASKEDFDDLCSLASLLGSVQWLFVTWETEDIDVPENLTSVGPVRNLWLYGEHIVERHSLLTGLFSIFPTVQSLRLSDEKSCSASSDTDIINVADALSKLHLKEIIPVGAVVYDFLTQCFVMKPPMHLEAIEPSDDRTRPSARAFTALVAACGSSLMKLQFELPFSKDDQEEADNNKGNTNLDQGNASAARYHWAKLFQPCISLECIKIKASIEDVHYIATMFSSAALPCLKHVELELQCHLFYEVERDSLQDLAERLDDVDSFPALHVVSVHVVAECYHKDWSNMRWAFKQMFESLRERGIAELRFVNTQITPFTSDEE
ncbi:hypothetical protein CERSUDRAFT_72536 [Gelatoporia subvermispora B]|uniref:F-box domain-containing protein n=1 Tax=Ceriporiopsis subvermispora (strain B) TaxID=914234 RepID=M2RKN1_CERS8|nr:hypothetical protein CERSUDRAFT_72536 [Gelatoporia subvermispora B]